MALSEARTRSTCTSESDATKIVLGDVNMDYDQFEPDYPARAFRSRKKPKCGGVKGKEHKYKTIAGNDCHWKHDSYDWCDYSYWHWVCECVTYCVNCNVRRWGRWRYNGCAHNDYKKFTKPEGVKIK